MTADTTFKVLLLTLMFFGGFTIQFLYLFLGGVKSFRDSFYTALVVIVVMIVPNVLLSGSKMGAFTGIAVLAGTLVCTLFLGNKIQTFWNSTVRIVTKEAVENMVRAGVLTVPDATGQPLSVEQGLEKLEKGGIK